MAFGLDNIIGAIIPLVGSIGGFALGGPVGSMIGGGLGSLATRGFGMGSGVSDLAGAVGPFAAGGLAGKGLLGAGALAKAQSGSSPLDLFGGGKGKALGAGGGLDIGSLIKASLLGGALKELSNFVLKEREGTIARELKQTPAFTERDIQMAQSQPTLGVAPPTAAGGDIMTRFQNLRQSIGV